MLGREEAILPFPPPPTSPDHARLVFAGLVFATSVLSESLTEATICRSLENREKSLRHGSKISG